MGEELGDKKIVLKLIKVINHLLGREVRGRERVCIINSENEENNTLLIVFFNN